MHASLCGTDCGPCPSVACADGTVLGPQPGSLRAQHLQILHSWVLDLAIRCPRAVAPGSSSVTRACCWVCVLVPQCHSRGQLPRPLVPDCWDRGRRVCRVCPRCARCWLTSPSLGQHGRRATGPCLRLRCLARGCPAGMVCHPSARAPRRQRVLHASAKMGTLTLLLCTGRGKRAQRLALQGAPGSCPPRHF